ncbi:MAG: hypothetical protein EP315_03420 [Gammaproteobacteria bacterium]|nr:MAG: hypothetical protein EP315_03420 [Gammaproteobacteria bacterium]
MSHILVIDQGTHASRAILVSAQGEIIDHAEKTVSLNRISHDRVEQDAEEILQSIHDALGKISQRELNQCTSAALTTQRSTLLAWHADTRRAITPALSWQDRRSQNDLTGFRSAEHDIKHITGLPLSPHYGAGKLRWLLQQDEQVQRALQQHELRMGPLTSFLLCHLLEQHSNLLDHSNAQRTQLFDLQRLDWSPELLKLFAVPHDVLPQCVPMIHPYGKLQLHGMPLQCVCGDQNAALHGMGRLGDGDALINIGTGAFVLAACEKIMVDTPLLCGIAASHDHHCQYLLEGTVNGAGAALDWAQQQYPQTDLFQYLPDWLQQDMEPPLFINTVGGLGSPWWHSSTPAHFIHDAEASIAARYVAIIESIVFLLQHNMQILQQKLPLRQLYISGGLSRLTGLCQKLADLSRLPVTQLEQPEATALGAAWLSRGCPSHWRRQQAKQYFIPQANMALQKRFQLFTESISRLTNSV